MKNKDIPGNWSIGRPKATNKYAKKEYGVFQNYTRGDDKTGVYPVPPWLAKEESQEQYQKFRFAKDYDQRDQTRDEHAYSGSKAYGDIEVYKSVTPKPPHLNPPQPISEEEPLIGLPMKRLNVLDYFGINPDIPTLVVLKISSIVLIILCVELNSLINLSTLHPELQKVLGQNVQPFIGISLIGLFIGILFKYIDYELQHLKFIPENKKQVRFKSYLTLIFLLAIGIFIILEVIVELINVRGALTGAKAGGLFLVDLLNILIVTFGTYAIFSRNRGMVILAVVFLTIIMLLGIEYGQDMISMVLLGAILVLYIEITDGAIRLSEYADKFHDMIEDYDILGKSKFTINMHMDSISYSFAKTLGIFFILTLLITGIMLMIFVTYPYVTPTFMNENLEVQTVYGLVPIIMLLLVIFLTYYLLTRYITPMMNKMARK
jgi:hypothetical protein